MQCDMSCIGGGHKFALVQLDVHKVSLSLLLHAGVHAVSVGYTELVVSAETKWLHIFV
jgi:hypothetical protein